MTYIIYTDGIVIKAENESIGKVDFTGTDISTILTSINNTITIGETETIYFKGHATYSPNSQVVFTKSVNLVADKNVTFNWKGSGYLFIFTGTLLSTTNITSDINVKLYMLDKAFQYVASGSIYTDYTTQINNTTTTDVPLFDSTPNINDAFYFGSNYRFDIIKLNLGTACTGITVVWEYYNGAWTALTGGLANTSSVQDGTAGFTVSGIKNIHLHTVDDEIKTYVNGTNDFWIRVRVTAVSSPTQPIVAQAWTYIDNPRFSYANMRYVDSNSGQKMVTVNSTMAIQPGQWVKLVSYDSTYHSLISELIQVDSVDSATQVTMKTNLVNTYALVNSPWIVINSIINVTNAGTAQIGDLILISDITWWNPIDWPNWPTAELHEISTIGGPTGSTVETTDGLLHSFTVVENGTAKLIRPITVTIDGITINGLDRTSSYYGIQLYYNKNSIIRNCTLKNNGLIEIDLTLCFNTIIENNVIGDCIRPGYGYGIGVSDGSAYTKISKNYFYNSRHCITLGGNGIAQPRDVFVIANTFADASGIGTVIDAHLGESYYVYDNIIYCPIVESCFASGARINKFIGNTVIGGIGTGPRAQYCNGITYDIIDNTFIDTQSIFGTGVTGNVNYRVNIENNIIKGKAYGLATIYNALSFNIIGNHFLGNGNSGFIIYISNPKLGGGKISNNRITNSLVAQLYLSSTNNITISDNIFENWITDGNDAIFLLNSSYNTISGNIFIKAGNKVYGIESQGTSDYNRIFNNDFTRCGTVVANRILTPGTNTKIWKNTGFITDNSGSSIGTGVQQAIPHGLAIIPTRQQIVLFSGSATANPYHSADPGATYIYVTTALNQPWYWATVGV